MKNPFRKVFVNWTGWRGEIFDHGWRFNSGAPYSYWRIGPIFIRKYM